MALVNIKDMLEKARAEKYCVGAFDASTIEMAMKIVEAAEEKKSPVILMGLTPDLQQLLFFEDVLVTPGGDEPAVQEYLSRYPEAAHCVVFVDVDRFWSSGYDPDQVLPVLLEHTDFQSSELLYWNYLSKAYVLNK